MENKKFTEGASVGEETAILVKPVKAKPRGSVAVKQESKPLTGMKQIEQAQTQEQSQEQEQILHTKLVVDALAGKNHFDYGMLINVTHNANSIDIDLKYYDDRFEMPVRDHKANFFQKLKTSWNEALAVTKKRKFEKELYEDLVIGLKPMMRQFFDSVKSYGGDLTVIMVKQYADHDKEQIVLFADDVSDLTAEEIKDYMEEVL